MAMETVSEMLVREGQDEDFDLLEAVKGRAEADGWNEILSETLALLADPSRREYWRSAMAIVYWASSDWPEITTPKMAVVARLYWCLRQPPGFDEVGLGDIENLVWSAAIGLKGVNYLSEWAPEEDPEVRGFMATMG